jgi:curved DNA-binding protein CbpA
MQNPYEILGVSENDSIEHINSVYKNFLIYLHPDKSNLNKDLNMSYEEKVEYLNIIKSAYKQILETRKESKYPDYKIDYVIDGDLRINIKNDIKFDSTFNTKFNEVFEKAREQDKKAGMDDPFNRGYDEFSSNKDYNNTNKVIMPSYNPDIKIEKPKKIKENKIIEYVPDGLSYNNFINNNQELGLSSINDFSMSTDGKCAIYGSDLNKVYGDNNELWEDTVKRDSFLSSKYNNDTDINKRFMEMRNDRGNIYNLPLDKKLIKTQIKKNKLDEINQKERENNLNYRDEYFNSMNLGRLKEMESKFKR